MKNALTVFLCILFLPPQSKAQLFLFGTPESQGTSAIIQADRFNKENKALFMFNPIPGIKRVILACEVDSGQVLGIAEESHSQDRFIFRWNPISGDFQSLRSLNQSTRGPFIQLTLAGPDHAVLMNIKGKGSLSIFDHRANLLNKVYEFTDTTGAAPYDQLVWDGHDRVYGVTSFGGVNHGGTLYSFSISTKAYKVEHSFSVGENSQLAGLYYHDSAGILGCYQLGGKNGRGYLFQYKPSDSSFRVLLNYDKLTNSPSTAPVLSGQTIYGAGTHGIYALDLRDTTKLQVVSFQQGIPNAVSPHSLLSMRKDSVLVMFCTNDGSNRMGGITSYDWRTGKFKEEYAFSSRNGFNLSFANISPSGRSCAIMTPHYNGQRGNLIMFDSLYRLMSQIRFCEYPDGMGSEHRLVGSRDKSIYLLQRFGGEFDKGMLMRADFPYDHLVPLHHFGGQMKRNFDTLPNCPDPQTLIRVNDTVLAFVTTYGGSNGAGSLCLFSTLTNRIFQQHSFNAWLAPRGRLSLGEKGIYGWVEHIPASELHIYEYRIGDQAFDTILNPGGRDLNFFHDAGALSIVGNKLFGVFESGGPVIGFPDSATLGLYEFDLNTRSFERLRVPGLDESTHANGGCINIQGNQVAFMTRGGFPDSTKLIFFDLVTRSFSMAHIPRDFGEFPVSDPLFVPEYNSVALLYANNPGPIKATIVLVGVGSGQVEKVSEVGGPLYFTKISGSHLDLLFIPTDSIPLSLPWIAVYPNPSEGRIKVKGLSFPLEYALYTSDGRLVGKGTLEHGNQEIIADGNTSGMYFLKLTNAETTHTSVVVLRR